MTANLWCAVARISSCLLLSFVSVLMVLAPGCTQGWHDPSKHNIQFITVANGVRLEVLDWSGSGPPLVLLAGLGTTAHVFDGFAERLTQSNHVYGITRRGYGASSRTPSGYSEQSRADDDLKVFEALKLVKPVVAGHSIAGDELSQLGIHHYDRIRGLVYLDALNDITDDYTEYVALCAKLPKAMQRAPSPADSDLKSFKVYREWRIATGQVAMPESELRNEFAANRDGSVGDYVASNDDVPAAMIAGREKHDYSQILVPVLALVVFPKTPDKQIRENHVTNEGERTIVQAVYRMYVGMTRHRIDRIRASGGARAVELWGADHYVFLSNPDDVLREVRVFLPSLQ